MKTRAMDKVDRLIVSMLRENTGAAMLDSGGAYGRNWQRNQKKTARDFLREPSVRWEKDYGYTISLFHYLRRDLSLDETCEKFNRINARANNWESEIYGTSDKAYEYLINELGGKVERDFNSYNGDSSLSQVIQGTWVKVEDKTYLVLQIHGGCDVRGGYTNARLFLVPGYEDGALREDVYGVVTKKDGTKVQVDNCYNGYSLTGDNGKDVTIEDGDTVDLYLSES